MKNTILKISAIAASLLACVSCADKLDISQHSVLNYETYYNTDEQINSASAAMYLELRGADFNALLCKNMLTDDFYAGGAQRGDNYDLELLNEFTFDSESSYVENMFKTFYSLIYKANVVLGHVNPEGSAIAKMAIAEAHVFRAYAYFELISMWGNPPLVDHELLPSEYSCPNGTTEELWALVESDLNEAINSGSLTEKSGLNDSATWRVTKQFAQAILGKAYLWQNKYKEAAAEFDKVVESRKYDLYRGNYGDMRLVSEKHNCESMFESNKVFDTNNLGQNFSLYYLMTNYRTDKMDGVQQSNIMNTGWGFCVPTKDLYDAFVKNDGENGYRLTETMKTLDQLKQATGITITPGKSMISEGYFMWKTRVLKETTDDGDFTNHSNTMWMRYAEVLLCGAEAHLNAGNQAKALEYVNAIRSRARLSTLSSVTLEQIKTEKRLELCGEALRYQDLIRWGEAESAMKDNGKVFPLLSANGSVAYTESGNAKAGFKPRNNRLPYPATEQRLNSNLTQNEGY